MTTSSKAVTDASDWLRPIAGATALVANLLVLATLAFAALQNEYDPDLYYLSVQEDEYLEWATFWAFLGAWYPWTYSGEWVERRRTAPRRPA